MLEAFQNSKSLILAAYPQLANSDLINVENSLRIYSINLQADNRLETKGWYSINPEGFYSVRIGFPEDSKLNLISLEAEKAKLKDELSGNYSIQTHENAGYLSIVAISGDYTCSFDVLTRILLQDNTHYHKESLPIGEITKFKLQIFIERELQVLRETLGAEPDALFLILASCCLS
jgi:hypothetical protein